VAVATVFFGEKELANEFCQSAKPGVGRADSALDIRCIYMYFGLEMERPRRALPVLPCACANLRRSARAVTRMYNQELQMTGLELTQFTLLMALDITGEITQKDLGRLLALDTTTLTRVLQPLIKHGWIRVKAGDDRRVRLLLLTSAGQRKLQESQPHWDRAQRQLRSKLGERTWNQLGTLLTEIAETTAEV